ncbi:similar to Saccharomyces cerevisiae YOR368W RAD17 Checkpoint protein, involved in the activation of the DNA damage and meiotic pachytene checkpoints [Maudiozyma saulgeensis]|uniref:DNA damage checkpoint control protein RAD17 n=1 Tax=Maudiozyma saulgeensis TaxID=1789683 RepID=A0A1X7R7L0_9SACH|nr:similar to Saccharomyces cerevisiae YOR368W RAD17 Checkpoint protein, involved in the activation of the DNA damage and meiotic pachytene checkpoints [Kazachstania saulgeensis]
MDDELSRFVATTVHLDHITTALNCLTAFGLKEDVLIYIDRDGLSFVRENNHVIKIQLLLARELFISYSYNDARDDNDDENSEGYMKLCVKINHLLDSVNIMNKNIDDIVECTMSYDGNGSPFVLIFEDSMISERVEYRTYVIKDIDNTGLILDKEHMMFECIIKGDILYSALKDLKETNCKECYLYAKTMDTGENIFALISKSTLGLSKIVIPGSRSILEKLEVYKDDSTTLCYNVPVIGSFDFATFDKIRLSTKIASKVLFRMDVNGLLSVNVLSQTDDILISDNRQTGRNNNDTRNKSKSSKNSNNMDLPNDYPGIVSEICLLEKEMVEQNTQDEIELFMNVDEFGMVKKQNITAVPRYINPNDGISNNGNNSGSNIPSSNILNLTTEQTELVSKNFVGGETNGNTSMDVVNNNNNNGNKDDDDDDDDQNMTNSSVTYGNADLPLFF